MLLKPLLKSLLKMVGASCKRKDALLQLHHEEVVKKIQSGEISTGKGLNQEISLTRPGGTRWGSHYKTLIRLFDMWNLVGNVLDAIHVDGGDAKIRGTAGSLSDRMFTFEFVFIGKLMLYLLGVTNTLPQMLQEKDQSIGRAIRLIEVVKNNLQTYRENGWDKLLKQVIDFCKEQEIDVPNMDDIVPGRAKRVVDGQPKTYYHRYRVEIFIKVIDLIIQECNNRFTETNTDLLKCISYLDPSNSFANFDHDQILHLAKIYSDDFSSAELMELDHQLINYISEFKESPEYSNLDDTGALAKKMVEMKDHTRFRLVYQLIELALILPVATATVERCFSAMNLVKIHLRTRMGDELLSDFLCYIEKKIFFSIEDEIILQCFQNLASRRNLLKLMTRKT